MALIVPTLGGVLLSQLVEGFSNAGVVVDELAVQVCKAKEGLYLLNIFWRGPVENGFNLCRVYADSLWDDDDTKIFDFYGVK